MYLNKIQSTINNNIINSFEKAVLPPKEGEVRKYKDGDYKFSGGHWKKVKQSEEKKVEKKKTSIENIKKYGKEDYETLQKLYSSGIENRIDSDILDAMKKRLNELSSKSEKKEENPIKGEIWINDYDGIKVTIDSIDKEEVGVKYTDKKSIINEYGNGREVKEMFNTVEKEPLESFKKNFSKLN